MYRTDAEGFIPLFPQDEIPSIIIEVLTYARNLRKRSETDHENQLTQRLFRMIINSERHRSSPARLHLELEYHIFGRENTDEDPNMYKVDLAYVWGSQHYVYFGIEAKRLHVRFDSGRRSLIGNYVTGDQGMMCFISGRYSAGQQSAAMLGYVFDGAVSAAADGISGMINKNRNILRMRQNEGMSISAILDGMDFNSENSVGETVHELERGEFVLYHLLVPV